MNKLRLFFTVLLRSITDFPFYKEIIKTPLSFSFKYFALLCFLMSIIYSLFIFTTLIPELNRGIKEVNRYAKQTYPDDLVFTLKNGRLTTNKQDPIIIANPDTKPGINTNLLVIDTQANVGDYEHYDTVILITDTSASFRRDTNRIETYSFADIKDMQIDKYLVIGMVDKAQQYINVFTPILSTVIFIVLIIFVLIFNLIRVLFYSLITLVITKILDIQLPYKKVLQISLHSSTVVIIVSSFLGLFSVNIPIPLFYSILFAIFTTLILNHIKPDLAFSKKPSKKEDAHAS